MKNTVLIVDDEEVIRSILKEQFSESGFIVIEASDGEKGLAQFEENQVDVILSNIKMPNMDGIDFCKQAKGLKSKIPIFLVTAFSEYSEKDILAIGAEAIIFKPFDLEEIVELVRDTISRKQV